MSNNNKEKKDVVIAMGAICIIIFVFLWKFLFSSSPHEIAPIATIKTAPRIDFNFLESSDFKKFEKYKTIEPLKEEFLGKENPFISY